MKPDGAETDEWTGTINATLVEVLRRLDEVGKRLDASALAHAALIERLERLDHELRWLNQRIDEQRLTVEQHLDAHWRSR